MHGTVAGRVGRLGGQTKEQHIISFFLIVHLVCDLRLTEAAPRAMSSRFLTKVWAVVPLFMGLLKLTSSSTPPPFIGLCLFYIFFVHYIMHCPSC